MDDITMIRVALTTLIVVVTAGIFLGRLRASWLPVGIFASIALMFV